MKRPFTTLLSSISLMILASLVTLPCVSPVRAQARVGVATADARIFPLEDLRPGMKGTARTVFSGIRLLMPPFCRKSGPAFARNRRDAVRNRPRRPSNRRNRCKCNKTGCTCI